MKRGPKDPLIRSAQVRSIDEENRKIEAVASTEAVDSYGTILRANWELTRFKANPVLLYGHNDQLLPVGTCENVRVDGKDLVFVAAFDDATDFDQQVWEKYRRGVLRGFSVRFNPFERRVIESDGRQIIEYTRSELLEISCVPVPANPEALRRSAGGSQKGEAMKKSALMKALRSMRDGDGSEDEKKAAAELYEKMGGDEGCKAAEEEDGKDDDGDGGGDGGGDEGPTSDRAAAAPRRAPTPTAQRAGGTEVINLAIRVAELEVAEQRRAVERLVDKHADRFTPTTRAWALTQSRGVVESYIKVAPKLDLRAPTTAPATRGEEQGTAPVHTIPVEDERKLDKMFGIRREPESIGYGEVDPIRGVRTFQAPSPGKVRAAQNNRQGVK